MGSALMGSLQLLCFCSAGILVGTLSNVFSQECQDMLFFRSGNIHFFCRGPISVDPSCPQPPWVLLAGWSQTAS